MAIRVLIVDDRSVVREELRYILELTGTVEVVGEAANGWEAVRLAEALAPDIVLMDLEMPGMDGFEATRRLTESRRLKESRQTSAARSGLAVIVFSVYGSDFDQQRAMDAGAEAFILKGTDLQTILDTFKTFSHEEGK